MPTTPPPPLVQTVHLPPTPPPRRRGIRVALIAVITGACLAVLLAVGAIALGVSVGKAGTQDTVSRSFPGVREIVVEADGGSVTLRAATGPDARVDTTRFWTPGYEPVVTSGVSGGVLTLTSDCPDFNIGCETTHAITVPAGTDVRVHTIGGAIEAVGLDSPRFSADAVGGPVTASFTAPPEDVRVQTVAGPVRVTVPQAGYRVTAETVVGAVHIGVAQDPASARTISAHTVTGPVDVLPG
jgi:hypothetical protein